VSFTVTEWAEIFTAVGTIGLSIVTAVITIIQIRRQKKAKIENWRDQHLGVHYQYLVSKLEELAKKLTPNLEDNLVFKELCTPRNNYNIEDSGKVVLNEYTELTLLADEKSLVICHISSGYSEIYKHVSKINKEEIEYRTNLELTLQKFVDTVHSNFRKEFKGWGFDVSAYSSVKDQVNPEARIIEATKDNEISKTINIREIAYCFVDSIAKGISNISARKQYEDPDIDIILPSNGIIFKMQVHSFDSWKQNSRVIAQVKGDYIKDEELDKFSALWDKINGDCKDEINKMHKMSEQIKSEYSALLTEIQEVINSYKAGLRINGECKICVKTKKTKDKNIRPYVEVSTKDNSIKEQER
jgi:hypothetical protein